MCLGIFRKLYRDDFYLPRDHLQSQKRSSQNYEKQKQDDDSNVDPTEEYHGKLYVQRKRPRHTGPLKYSIRNRLRSEQVGL